MDQMITQRRLSTDQVEAFFHDEFVTDQVRDFAEIMGDVEGVVADIGGGCGYFAQALTQSTGRPTRVIDMDPASVEAAMRGGVQAEFGDALAPVARGDEGAVCFNLILHHLVAGSESETRELQKTALSAWRGRVDALFVNEYIYQSMIGTVSGALIYLITVNPVLSFIGRQVAKVIPAFAANTFGVGVRFRSHEEWIALFKEAGYEVADVRIGEPEPISRPLRALLIRTIRRDSFRLEPIAIIG